MAPPHPQNKIQSPQAGKQGTSEPASTLPFQSSFPPHPYGDTFAPARTQHPLLQLVLQIHQPPSSPLCLCGFLSTKPNTYAYHLLPQYPAAHKLKLLTLPSLHHVDVPRLTVPLFSTISPLQCQQSSTTYGPNTISSTVQAAISFNNSLLLTKSFPREKKK